MNVPREIIAKDIITYCKRKKKKYIRTKYMKGKIASSTTKGIYSPSQLGSGLRHLNKIGMVERVSGSSFKLISYELEKGKE